ERERRLLLRLAVEESERAQAEAPERVVKLRRANCHNSHYGLGGPFPCLQSAGRGQTCARATHSRQGLTAGTPGGRAVGGALAPREDGGAAARTRPARPPVDGAPLAPGLERAPHEERGFLERCPQLVVGRLAECEPGRHTRSPERLRLP